MNSKIVMNHRQMGWLVCTLLTTDGLLIGQRELVRVSSYDAWFSYIPPVLYIAGIASILVYFSRLFPGQHLFDISVSLCGAWGGKILNALVISYLWVVLVRDLSAISSFVKATLLPSTPYHMIILCFILLLMQYGKGSIEVPCRINDMLWPLFFLLIVSLPLILANEFKFHRTQPYLVTPAVNMWIGGYINLGWFSDFIVTGAFLHTMASPRQLAAAFRNGIITSAFTLTLLLFVTLNVLGGNIASRAMYPSYTLVQQINVTDFLDRVDAFVFAIWIPMTVIKLVFIFLALLTGIQSFIRSSGSSDYRYISRAVCWFLLFSTIMSFRNIAEVFTLSNYAMTFLSLATQLAPLLLMLVLCRRRQHKLQLIPIADEAVQDQNGFRRFKTLRRWTNVLLAACLGIFVIGPFLAPLHSTIGKLLAILYGMSLVGAALLTRIESETVVKLNTSKSTDGEPQATSPI
jgi:spore germination protein KB